MNSLIRGSLNNPYAVTVMALAMALIGILTMQRIPIDILPVYKSPAVQILTFYGGMPAVGMEKSITNRMERGTGMASGVARQESRSIVGVSLVRNFFQNSVDPSGALTEESSLAQWEFPTMPPGTLPPVVMPYDPSSTVPVSLVALDSKTETEQVLYDVGRYEVRNMLMSVPGAIAPVVYGGKIRAVLLYLDRIRMQSRQLAPTDVMKAMDNYNLFLPTGSVKIGDQDYAVESNSMFDLVEQMKDIPLRNNYDVPSFLKDVAEPHDSSFIQTNVVRVNGRRQVYVPVYKQRGASTLAVVNKIKKDLPEMQSRLSRPGVNLELVMDQSVYVRSSIAALAQEGLLGAVLCSLVILLFLGEWRMTLIAVITIPLAVLVAIACLQSVGETINVMTLAGLALAIGPLVDVAIICLENTHRHMTNGVPVMEAAYRGSSEVALPALVSTLCTFLVLMPLVFVPGMGEFLFWPMTLAVFFAMVTAYFLAQTLVPSYSGLFLKPHASHEHDHHPRKKTLFSRWEGLISRTIAGYVQALDVTLRRRLLTLCVAIGIVVAAVMIIGPRLGREFFPDVDAGSFEFVVRAPTGTRIEQTEKLVEQVEAVVRDSIPEHDLQMIVSQIGVTPDISAAYTPNAGPMDAVIKVQLAQHRKMTSQHYVREMRRILTTHPQLGTLEYAFDAGGMVRSALNEGKSSPINIRVTGKDSVLANSIAESLKREVSKIDGVVDSYIVQRLNYPQLTINVDRSKAATLGLSQEDIMRNVIAACNSSISFNKRNFWIDPVSRNQYFVGVQYPEEDIKSIETMLDIPITGPNQASPVPLRSVATITRSTVPSEITHSNIQPTIDLTLGIDGRSLGDVADDITKVISKYGEVTDTEGTWNTIDPRVPGEKKILPGSKIIMAGEYAKMQSTFNSLGYALLLAALLIYFLLVGLNRSFVVPLTVMLVLPLSLAGVLPMLYFTGTALNVQSLLGVIFVIGIQVANMVLMTDFAQELRRTEGLSPTEAIRKSAAIRVRPITMTALAAFFAMVPAALALEHGSEANAPLARAILGGLLAGEPATLFGLPILYSLLVRDKKPKTTPPAPAPKLETVTA